MRIPFTFPTSHGPRRLPARPAIDIRVSFHELHLLTRALELEADAAEREGLEHVAESLAWRVAGLREAGR